MNADNELLASAYVDGELTDGERRSVEADPAVMAEVAQLRALRAELANVETPSGTARETAIATALGAFREQYAVVPPPVTETRSAAAPTDTPVLTFWRRPAAVRWLGAAAAIVAIGVLGVVVATSGSVDDDANLATDVAVEEASDDVASAPTADEPVLTEAPKVARTEMPESADEPAEPAAEEAASEPVVAEALDDEPTADAAAPLAESAAAESATPDGARFFDFENSNDPFVITEPTELGAAGTYLAEVEATRPATLTPTPNTSCGPALARAVLAVGNEQIEVYVEIDLASGLVVAYDVDCTVLLTAELAP